MHAALLPLAVNQSYDFEEDRHTHSSLPGTIEGQKHPSMQSPRPLPSSHSGAVPCKFTAVDNSDNVYKDTDSASPRAKLLDICLSRENTGVGDVVEPSMETKQGIMFIMYNYDILALILH